jgi:hypothetical protein
VRQSNKISIYPLIECAVYINYYIINKCSAKSQFKIRNFMTATTQPILTDSITDSSAIAGIKEPVVLRYFETFNAEDFAAAADLFDAEGVLNAPFEQPIVGRTAIETYLKAEARGMQLYPQQSDSQTLEDGSVEIQVRGKVQTSVFAVNIGWRFVLNSQQTIQAVTVKLLASPQELLNLRPLTKF